MLFNRIISWYRQKQVRRAAKKYDLDFEVRCAFIEQVSPMCRGLKYGIGEVVEVPMKSGRVALYKVTGERYCYVFKDTGQKNWKFEFQGYSTGPFH